ncbi:MAG: ankyrin repeat domain-containing protein [Candidatus Aminicenantes bacterium]
MKAKALFLFLLILIAAGILGFSQGIEEAMAAVYMKDYEKAREIINSGINVNEKVRGSYLLNVACYRGHLDTVKLLLDKGADINSVADDGSTPLIQAGTGDKTGEIVSFLLENGVEVNAADKTGMTALGNSIFKICTSGENSRLKVLEILLNHGADFSTPASGDEDKGYTWLMIACTWNQIELAEFLITKGLDVNHQADDGTTSLMVACKEGFGELVKVLVDHGADIHITTDSGETAAGIAEKEGYTEIADYLRSIKLL